MNKVLVVIDMQHDFIDGVLGSFEAQAIVPAVVNKVAEYTKNEDSVVFTMDTHYEDYLKTQEGRLLPVEHCIVDTDGWRIHKGIDTTGHTILKKDTFGFPDWALYFDWDEDTEIELVGVCTDICVISNAMILKAAYPEAKIVVDSSCCAGVTPESHNNALAAMAACQIEIKR